MKDWEKRNAEEMVEGLVGMDLDAIEVTLGKLSGKSLVRLQEHLATRYKPAQKSFAEIISSVCVTIAAERFLELQKGGAGE